MPNESDVYFEENDPLRPHQIIITFLNLYAVFSGILKKITKKSDTIYLDFVGGYTLVLKGCNAAFIERLKQFIGKKIGIQHTDLPENPYILKRMRTRRYYDTTKKRNRLETPSIFYDIDKKYSYMRKYRKGYYIDPYKNITESQRFLLETYQTGNEEIHNDDPRVM